MDGKGTLFGDFLPDFYGLDKKRRDKRAVFGQIDKEKPRQRGFLKLCFSRALGYDIIGRARSAYHLQHY
jgi:hypothetical protein